MSEEFHALQSQGAWSLVPLPQNHFVILSQMKAHLVAKGFHQEPGLDYHKTFNLVAKHPTIKVSL